MSGAGARVSELTGAELSNAEAAAVTRVRAEVVRFDDPLLRRAATATVHLAAR